MGNAIHCEWALTSYGHSAAMNRLRMTFGCHSGVALNRKIRPPSGELIDIVSELYDKRQPSQKTESSDPNILKVKPERRPTPFLIYEYVVLFGVIWVTQFIADGL